MIFPSGIQRVTAYLAGAMTKNASKRNTSGCRRSESSQGFMSASIKD